MKMAKIHEKHVLLAGKGSAQHPSTLVARKLDNSSNNSCLEGDDIRDFKNPGIRDLNFGKSREFPGSRDFFCFS